jgi:2-polyprenyl-3-methyl-5-hydroxy-6-metoxy-1,4-benzoquinol methylase
MQYDPVKDRIGSIAEKSPLLRRLFFSLLNLLFLRAWYVKREMHRVLPSLAVNGTLRVLDAGTGFAQYAYYIAKNFRNARVMAVDVKDEYLRSAESFIAKTPLVDRIVFGKEDLTALSLEGPFDFVLSVDVMEHIEDDEAVFRHFARVLRPGGMVLINTPSDMGGSDVHGDDESSFIEEHVRDGYNLEELQSKLRAAGLLPVRGFHTYGPYGSAAWRLLIKHPIQWLGTSKAAYLLMPFYYAVALPIGTLLNLLDVRRENATGTGVLVLARKPE